jgi:hypothetical protein
VKFFPVRPSPALLLACVVFHANGQEIETHCRGIAEAASAAEVEREAGRSLEEAKERLVGRFHPTQLNAGANATYAWPLLRGFPLADFVEKHCRVMVPSGGNVPDLQRMMIQSFYIRSVQCSQEGHIERQSFAACWNKQAKSMSPVSPAEQK